MTQILITGWRPGLAKVSMTEALREHADLGLADAKAITDRVLDGQTATVKVASDEAAAALINRLEQLGATAQRAPESDPRAV
jgi:ribosomal protein L7/L12